MRLDIRSDERSVGDADLAEGVGLDVERSVTSGLEGETDGSTKTFEDLSLTEDRIGIKEVLELTYTEIILQDNWDYLASKSECCVVEDTVLEAVYGDLTRKMRQNGWRLRYTDDYEW